MDYKELKDMENDYYGAIAKKIGKQMYIPNILLEAAEVENGDYIEIKIRKINNPKNLVKK